MKIVNEKCIIKKDYFNLAYREMIELSAAENRDFTRIYNKVKRLIAVLAAMGIIIFSVCIGFKNYAKARAYDESAKEMSSKCQDVQTQISEKEKLIDGEGFDSYCEKIAREKYGYAKPGETVIYDSAYGN